MSAKTNNKNVSIQSIDGNKDAAQDLPHGERLMAFAEAIATRNPNAIQHSRQALHTAAGPAVLVDAAGVAANFQRMVRIADAIGIPVDDMNSELGQSVRLDLGLERFASAQNTLAAGKA